MNITVKYDRWPRRRDNTLLFLSTRDAFFYASQVYDRPVQVTELVKEFEAINEVLKKEKLSKKPNLSYMLNSSFKRQFIRECLEEIDRLKSTMGG